MAAADTEDNLNGEAEHPGAPFHGEENHLMEIGQEGNIKGNVNILICVPLHCAQLTIELSLRLFSSK